MTTSEGEDFSYLACIIFDVELTYTLAADSAQEKQVVEVELLGVVVAISMVRPSQMTVLCA